MRLVYYLAAIPKQGPSADHLFSLVLLTMTSGAWALTYAGVHSMAACSSPSAPARGARRQCAHLHASLYSPEAIQYTVLDDVVLTLQAAQIANVYSGKGFDAAYPWLVTLTYLVGTYFFTLGWCAMRTAAGGNLCRVLHTLLTSVCQQATLPCLQGRLLAGSACISTSVCSAAARHVDIKPSR